VKGAQIARYASRDSKMEKFHMKYKFAVTVFSAAMLAGSFAVPAVHAWDGDRGFESKRGISGGDPDQSWNEFLNNGNNDDFARRYRENPDIIYDKDVMAHEPGVRAWLDQHPGARQDIYGRAGAQREKRWERRHERRANGW
jgi:hypothetical protein